MVWPHFQPRMLDLLALWEAICEAYSIFPSKKIEISVILPKILSTSYFVNSSDVYEYKCKLTFYFPNHAEQLSTSPADDVLIFLSSKKFSVFDFSAKIYANKSYRKPLLFMSFVNDPKCLGLHKCHNTSTVIQHGV